jgi:hypothetical protein
MFIDIDEEDLLEMPLVIYEEIMQRLDEAGQCIDEADDEKCEQSFPPR